MLTKNSSGRGGVTRASRQLSMFVTDERTFIPTSHLSIYLEDFIDITMMVRNMHGSVPIRTTSGT